MPRRSLKKHTRKMLGGELNYEEMDKYVFTEEVVTKKDLIEKVIVPIITRNEIKITNSVYNTWHYITQNIDDYLNKEHKYYPLHLIIPIIEGILVKLTTSRESLIQDIQRLNPEKLSEIIKDINKVLLLINYLGSAFGKLLEQTQQEQSKIELENSNYNLLNDEEKKEVEKLADDKNKQDRKEKILESQRKIEQLQAQAQERKQLVRQTRLQAQAQAQERAQAQAQERAQSQVRAQGAGMRKKRRTNRRKGVGASKSLKKRSKNK